MSVNVQEIEAHEFAMVRRGYDPDEVRSYLRMVATSLQDAPARAYGDIGDRVASVFESAEKAAAEIMDGARREAEAIRHEVEANVKEHREQSSAALREAEDLAAAKIADADFYASATKAEADRVSEELRTSAEFEAAQILSRANELESRVNAETQRARVEVDEYVSHQTAAADGMRADLAERTVMIEKKAQQDLAAAQASASAVRKQADADAKRITADAKDAAERIVDDARDDAEQVINDAQREAVEIVLAAERKAAVRTDTVLRNAQQRLEIMVSAEREVFDRMARAFDALHGAPDIELSQPAALLGGPHSGGHDQNYLDR